MKNSKNICAGDVISCTHGDNMSFYVQVLRHGQKVPFGTIDPKKVDDRILVTVGIQNAEGVCRLMANCFGRRIGEAFSVRPWIINFPVL